MVLPFACYAWALWCWSHRDNSSLPTWRGWATTITVVLAGVSLALATFVLFDIYRHPIETSKTEIESVETGALVGLLGLLLSVFARSWTRIALSFSCASLLWVFFLIALSP